MNTITLPAPAHWAPALINRDLRGLTEQDLVEVGIWVVENRLDRVDALACSEEYIGTFEGRICSLVDYVFPN